MKSQQIIIHDYNINLIHYLIPQLYSHMKDHQYKLPSSLRNIHEAKKNQIQEYISRLEENPRTNNSKDNKVKQGLEKKSPDNHLFKLNPINATVSQMPVEVMKQKIKQKLQSLERRKSQEKQKQKEGGTFSIFQNNPVRIADKIIKDRSQFAKKYNIDISSIMGENLRREEDKQEEQVEVDEVGFLKPSEPYQLKNNKNFSPVSVFQTPILPCFKSEMTKKFEDGESKVINQKQGVWKIGKITIKGKKATMKIGNIEFDGQIIPAQGRASVLNQQTLYQLPNWNGMWIMEPKDHLFQ